MLNLPKLIVNSVMFGIIFLLTRLLLQNIMIKKEIPKTTDLISISFTYGLSYFLRQGFIDISGYKILFPFLD
jgi:hypothetical protein